MATKERIISKRGVISPTIKIEDEDEGINIFDGLLLGVRDMDRMNKYSKKRMIDNLLYSNSGIGAVLSRMKYIGIINGYEWISEKGKVSVKLIPANKKLNAREIRERIEPAL